MSTETTSPSIIVRSYQPSDLSACQKIFAEVHEAYGNPRSLIDYIQQTEMKEIEKKYLQNPRGHWWVAVSTDDNRVVGLVAILPLCVGDHVYYDELPGDKRDDICELLRMAVTSDAQRHGVGKKLLSTFLDFAREKGYRQVHLTTLMTMKKACAFYDKNGFKRGRVEKFAFANDFPKTPEELKKFFEHRLVPIVFEEGTTIPEEDQQLMKMSPAESKFMYAQHYSLML